MKTRERYSAVDWLALAICLVIPPLFWGAVIVGGYRLYLLIRGSLMTLHQAYATIAVLGALCFLLLMAALCFRADARRERRLKEYHAATLEIVRSGRWKRPN